MNEDQGAEWVGEGAPLLRGLRDTLFDGRALGCKVSEALVGGLEAIDEDQISADDRARAALATLQRGMRRRTEAYECEDVPCSVPQRRDACRS